MTGDTTRMGYGWEHQKERKQWAPKVATGTVHCARCAQPIDPDTPWDLDHTDDRTNYLGPSHVHCNRGGWTPPKPDPDPTPNTDWDE